MNGTVEKCWLVSSQHVGVYTVSEMGCQLPFEMGITTHIMMLTKREFQVLELVVKGLPNKAIAEQLGISYKTVEKQRQSVLRAAGVNHTVQLIHLVLRNGWLPNNFSGAMPEKLWIRERNTRSIREQVVCGAATLGTFGVGGNVSLPEPTSSPARSEDYL